MSPTMTETWVSHRHGTGLIPLHAEALRTGWVPRCTVSFTDGAGVFRSEQLRFDGARLPDRARADAYALEQGKLWVDSRVRGIARRRTDSRARS